MTGTVDWTTLSWVIGVVVASLGGGWRIVSWVQAALKERDLAIAASDARARFTEEQLRASVEAYKLYCAEHFATEDGVTRAIEPILKQLEKLNDRLDQLLTSPAPARPRRTT